MKTVLIFVGLIAADSARPDTAKALCEVVTEVSRLCEAENFDAARARLDEYEVELASLEPSAWYDRIQEDPGSSLEERALLPHARGVLEMQAGEQALAAAALEEARAQAGPGMIRLYSTYDLGVLYLEEGERFRALIPEFSNGAPGPSPLPQDAKEAPDPLESARENYLRSREWFVERLILDWRDVDTRANAELVQRRLRELDEIEREREEQQQDQEQQEPKEGEEPQESDEEGEESSEDEQEPGEESPENAEGEREPEEPEGEEEPEDEEESEEAEEAEAQEVHLTQEEMQRLLEALREIEEEGEEVQEALRRIGRQNVDRDW